MLGVETASHASHEVCRGLVENIESGRAHSYVPDTAIDAAGLEAEGRPFGILCATWGETIPFIERMEVRREVRRGPRSFFEGVFAGYEAVIACAGVGKVNAAMAAQQLIDSYPVWGIANAGAAGAASCALELFDIVVSTECVHHDVPGFVLPDSYPYYPSETFPSAPALLDAARRASESWSKPFVFGRTATGECFVDDSNRSAIVDACDPLAVDMETAAIAQTCFASRLPFIAVRCITDTPALSGFDSYAKNADKASSLACDAMASLLGSLMEAE